MAWRYKETTKGRKVRPNGTMLEHRYVAEKSLGRQLQTGEVVHHIDGNPSNNTANNLIVFASLTDHTRFHATGKLEKQLDGTYTSPENLIPCKVCQKLTKNKKYCSNICMRFGTRHVERPDKQTLASDISSMSWSAIGRKYGVSDNSIRKWAKYYGLR